jgi:hypothetical protein
MSRGMSRKWPPVARKTMAARAIPIVRPRMAGAPSVVMWTCSALRRYGCWGKGRAKVRQGFNGESRKRSDRTFRPPARRSALEPVTPNYAGCSVASQSGTPRLCRNSEVRNRAGPESWCARELPDARDVGCSLSRHGAVTSKRGLPPPLVVRQAKRRPSVLSQPAPRLAQSGLLSRSASGSALRVRRGSPRRA